MLLLYGMSYKSVNSDEREYACHGLRFIFIYQITSQTNSTHCLYVHCCVFVPFNISFHKCLSPGNHVKLLIVNNYRLLSCNERNLHVY